MEPVRVAVYSPDPLTVAGLSGALSAEAGFEVLEGLSPSDVDVRIVATYHLTSEILALLRRAAPTGVPVVLVINEITGPQVLAAIECRVVAVLSLQSATGDRLAHSVRTAAAGGGVLPPALLGEVLKHLERLQREVLEPQGLNAAGLNPREIEVLGLMADGMDTAEIAGKLCYSERTVKNVIAGVTKRLKLRNRSHAVAYAMRSGMI
ncbi:helix-turn-helix transcriptional regulator [Lentzea sp. E54]|uniref:helix-turn-helix transcriptional regulator n=1 Tax=Lentzea xerophila TaxID=3435883 RepID=UPI003DA4D252